MITDKLRATLATELKNAILSGQIGQGGNSTSPLANTLDVPITGITVTKSVEKSSENVVQIKLEILGTAITGLVIREAGLFDNATPASGNLLHRVNFEGVGPFSASERLQVFITMEVE